MGLYTGRGPYRDMAPAIEYRMQKHMETATSKAI